MFKVVSVLLVILVGDYVLGQQPAGPMLNYDDISYPNYQYGVHVSSLHEVDFKNLRVFWFAGEKPDRGVRLRNGTFKHKPKIGYAEVDLDLVEFLDPAEASARHAVIDLWWMDCGGSCSVVGRVQVFELQAGHPTVVQEIEYDRLHAPETGVRFDPQTQTLTITGRSDDHTPNCCPKNLDVMRFEWNGKRFAFASAKTIAITALSP